jgi:CheY-like chemotaxis protein
MSDVVSSDSSASEDRDHAFFTPLHQIIQYSEGLMERAAAEGRDDDARSAQGIATTAWKLTARIRSALDMLPAPRLAALDDAEVRLDDAGAAPQAGGRLLLVDDNDVNRELLSDRLRSRGYSVSAASGGQEALEAVERERFDVVLLDIMMKPVDGLQVLQVIRQTHSVAGLPVIMVTSKGKSADVVRALKLGANDYVTKPVDLNVTLARIGTQISLKRANEMVTALNRKLQEAQEKIASLLEPSGEALQDVPAWAAEVADDLAVMLHAVEIAVFVERDGVLEPLQPTSLPAPSLDDARTPAGDDVVPVIGMSGELFGALVVAGTATFIAMGFALSSLASTVETYGAIANLAFFPMMIFSGVYFRLDSAPKWLQYVTMVLPLSPFLRVLRAVFNDGASLAGHGLGLALLAGWAVLAFAIAVKRFRWV